MSAAQKGYQPYHLCKLRPGHRNEAVEPGGLEEHGEVEVRLRRVGQRHGVQRYPGVGRAKLVDVVHAHVTTYCPSAIALLPHRERPRPPGLAGTEKH